MADDFNLVLELLRDMRGKIDEVQQEQVAQGRRLVFIERHLANLQSD